MGKCFWNTEVHVYMETSGSDARSLFEKRWISSEMTNCTCCMQKLAACLDHEMQILSLLQSGGLDTSIALQGNRLQALPRPLR